MWIKTLKFMMVGRKVTPRDTIVETETAHGVPLVQKGHAIEVEAPQVAVAQPETDAPKAVKKAEIKAKD